MNVEINKTNSKARFDMRYLHFLVKELLKY